MTLIEEIVAGVKSLPVEKQEQAYRFVHDLHEQTLRERRTTLDRAFGRLSLEEVKEWERNAQSCRKIDVESW